MRRPAQTAREVKGGLLFTALFAAGGLLAGLGASLFSSPAGNVLLLAAAILLVLVPALLARKKHLGLQEIKAIVVAPEDPASGLVSGVFTLWVGAWGWLSFGLWVGVGLGLLTLSALVWGLVAWHLLAPQPETPWLEAEPLDESGGEKGFLHSGFEVFVAGSKLLEQSCAYCLAPFQKGELVVKCPKCGLPHHFECWRENEGCAAYGCNVHTVPAPLPVPSRSGAAPLQGAG